MTRRRIDSAGVITIILAAISLVNAGWSLYSSVTPNLFTEGFMEVRGRSLQHLKATLHAMGTLELDYAVEDYPGLTGDYFQIQHLMAPVILRRNTSGGPLLLKRFHSPAAVTPPAGFILIEEADDGLALFEKAEWQR